MHILPLKFNGGLINDDYEALVFHGQMISDRDSTQTCCRPCEAIVKVTLTTICATDIIFFRRYPVKPDCHRMSLLVLLTPGCGVTAITW